tara:strand:+ start:2945 stop:3823 length:879 start_codon:yes stop_codon:yes gene_type:complete
MGKHLVVAGDSWTFGSEIVNPKLGGKFKEWDSANNTYRIPRIWPTLFANKRSWQITNLGYPASSNDRILRTVESWLYENYLSTDEDTSNLRLIVGWTSPERKDFFYTDPLKQSHPGWTTIWPNQSHFDYVQPGMNDFFKQYVTFLHDEREANNRYVHQVKSLENLCKVHNIELCMFQAFYDAGTGIHNANDNTTFKDYVNKEYINDDREKQRLGMKHPGFHWHYGNELTKTMWDSVEEKRFYNKNKDPHTFFGWLKQQDDIDKVISGQHPSEHGHRLWAKEIERYVATELGW